MNTIDQINKLISIDQQIQSIDDSVDYIENRLSSFYNTTAEKEDLRRNIDHIKTLLNKDIIISKLSEDNIIAYRSVIDRGESVL